MKQKNPKLFSAIYGEVLTSVATETSIAKEV